MNKAIHADMIMLNAVLLRPAMYTMNGSFEEVVAFLEGYYSALAQSKVGNPDSERWAEFRLWLTQRYSDNRDETMRQIKSRNPDKPIDTLQAEWILFLSEAERH